MPVAIDFLMLQKMLLRTFQLYLDREDFCEDKKTWRAAKAIHARVLP